MLPSADDREFTNEMWQFVFNVRTDGKIGDVRMLKLPLSDGWKLWLL